MVIDGQFEMDEKELAIQIKMYEQLAAKHKKDEGRKSASPVRERAEKKKKGEGSEGGRREGETVGRGGKADPMMNKVDDFFSGLKEEQKAGGTNDFNFDFSSKPLSKPEPEKKDP